jgi:hypothetical protein
MDKNEIDERLHLYLNTQWSNNQYRQFKIADEKLWTELALQENELIRDLDDSSRNLVTQLRKEFWNLPYRRLAKHIERKYDVIKEENKITQ